MNEHSSSFIEPADGEKRWYDLFSRGARDWLRHNDKVSRAVRDQLPQLVSNIDVLGSKAARTLRVPVRFLEHYRFRLADDQAFTGVGQGKGEPGDILVAPPSDSEEGPGQGGNNEGGYQFVLELNLDDVVDWFWEELELPHLKRKEGRLRESDYSREGWNRRGVQSRLDRRRSVKEAIKRRAHGDDGPAFANEDLRFRQLVMRKKPSTEAAVFFAMDVSSSMTDRDRRLAKTFFFWVVQGLRRQYTEIKPVFIAHTIEAWEFDEDEFFQVTAAGGTVASSAFGKTLDIIEERFDPGRFNIYLFYVSDGANFSNDTGAAREALHRIGQVANFIGYAEVQSGIAHRSPMGAIFDELRAENSAIGSYPLSDSESVWHAIRAFFTEPSVAEG